VVPNAPLNLDTVANTAALVLQMDIQDKAAQLGGLAAYDLRAKGGGETGTLRKVIAIHESHVYEATLIVFAGTPDMATFDQWIGSITWSKPKAAADSVGPSRRLLTLQNGMKLRVPEPQRRRQTEETIAHMLDATDFGRQRAKVRVIEAPGQNHSLETLQRDMEQGLRSQNDIEGETEWALLPDRNDCSASGWCKARVGFIRLLITVNAHGAGTPMLIMVPDEPSQKFGDELLKEVAAGIEWE
jgi:hypothetical protein